MTLGSLFEGEILFFTIPALLGTGVFLLKLAMMMLAGLGGDLDADADADLGLDADGDLGDSTAAFKLLSIQTIAAFLMGFGCAGLAGYLGMEWSFKASLGAAIAFGVFMMWLMSMAMKFVYDLRVSGNIDIRQTVGLEGVVYTQIPEKGAGRGSVRVVVSNRLRIFNALSEGDAIRSQSRVRITRVNGDNSLTVVAI